MKSLDKNYIRIILSLFILATIFFGGLYWVASDDNPIVFQSEESSTKEYGPIFNRISWKSLKNQDIWVMQQTQKGYSDDYNKWDRLAIVIDKTKNPKTAQFIQTTPGSIDFSGHYKNIEFRVPCGMCHTNGPRAIRPILMEGSPIHLNWKDQVKIALWNLRIKLYGRIISGATTHINGLPRKNPFAFEDHFSTKHLDIKSCTKCHNESWLGRGFLQRQNFSSIRFMIEKGYMPPIGFEWTSPEKESLLKSLENL